MALEPTIVAPATTDTSSSYMDWPAIAAGAALAAAISFVLITFGSALGLSLTSVREGSGLSLTAFAIAAALWIVWSQVSSFFAGAYLTGRMRRRNYDATAHESDVRDGAHGLTVWAVGTLIGAALAISSITAVGSTAVSATSAAVTAGASGAAGQLDEGLFVDRLLRGTTPADKTAAPRGEVGRIIAASIVSGQLDAGDRDYLARLVASRTGQTPEQSAAAVDQTLQQAQAAAEAAKVAADKARRAAVIAAFVTAASLLISAAAAYVAAVMGGNHRDKQVVIAGWSLT